MERRSVSRQDGNLLSEVQRDAFDAKTPLANTLRKLVALGGVAGSTELREWASLELTAWRCRVTGSLVR